MSLVYVFGLAIATAYFVVKSRVLAFSRENAKHGYALRRDAYKSNHSGPAIAIDGALNLEALDPATIGDAAALANGPRMSGLKNTLDIIIAIALIVLLSPLLAATAIAIKLDSKGPVFYRQKRVGFHGRVFYVLKFRSMRTDAENDGPQYAAPGDGRITRVGRIIRKFRIDEIPQAVNVLRGEMSIVGPRPERPEFVCELERAIPHYHWRHLVKPGITGWAQVKYEYAASVEGARNKLRYDLYYIRHFSPLLDFIILLMTVRVALFGLGSR